MQNLGSAWLEIDLDAIVSNIRVITVLLVLFIPELALWLPRLMIGSG